MHDVARRAGVSVGTVSHALNHPDRLAAATLERVTAAIEDLGFVRSRSARQLRAGSSATVALVVRDIANPFYVEIARALEEHLAPHDLSMMLCSTGPDGARLERATRMVLEHQVRAVVVAAEQGSDEIADALLKRGYRVVLVDAGAQRRDVASVGVDSVAGGRLAVGHLLGLGRRRIGVLTGPPTVAQTIERLSGARRAVEQAGLAPDGVLTQIDAPAFTADGGADAMRRLLDAAPDCTGVFAANDIMAIGAMRQLRAHDHAIPDQIALVGYDDIPVAAELITPLTSVRQPVAELARLAGDLALAEGPAEPRRILLEPELVVRASAPPL